MDKAVFVRFWKKFATMIDNGVPLVATLTTLREEQGTTTLGSALETIIVDLKAGVRFSDCLQKHPTIFGRDIIQITRGGESAGRLDEVAKVISERLEEGVLTEPSEAAAAAMTSKEDDEKEEKDDASKDIVKRFNDVLKQAVAENASDIHLEALLEEPATSIGRIRFRLDGVLEEKMRVPGDVLRAMISRLKIMSALDVGQERLPQDGRIKIQINDEKVDMRVCVGPSVFGESACIRILRRNTFEKILSSSELVFPEKELRDELFEAARAPYGLFIASGPTGCGKTTTLYSLLARQNAKKCKIVTVEDPVEVILPDVHQVQIKPAIGLDFAPTLRHFLRMDPDIIFCAEIRDVETAVLLMKIAMTGHLVFTQLHSTDAISTVSRLLDIGLEPYLLAEVLTGIVNQRLIRRLCPSCRKPSPDHLVRLKELAAQEIPDDAVVYEAVGCDECGHTGYKGRRAIYEFLKMTPELRQVLRTNPSPVELEELAEKINFKRMFDNALPVILSGETSLIEVMRVCTYSKRSARGKTI